MENSGPADPAGKLVLIVDDDKDIRDMFEIILKKEGFNVVVAQDGEDAQARARSLSPDLILLDLMLPKTGGYETLHALQAEDTANIPIFVMTGRQLDDSTAEMIRQEPNVRDYFSKPLKTDMLIARLHEVLKTRRPTKNP